MKTLLFQTVPDILGWCWPLALGIDLLLLPLALWRRMRSGIGWLYVISSFVFGASLWFMSAITTFVLWGPVALVVGLVLFGVGVVPMAILASLLRAISGHSRYWGPFGSEIFILFLTFGVRALGLYIAEHSDYVRVD